MRVPFVDQHRLWTDTGRII